MKISKHLHSCLLIEEQGKTIIIDPGIFTYQDKALDISKLQKLDYLLITHDHPDHMHLPLVKEIIAKFPDVKIITNQSIVSILEKKSIKATSEGDAIVSIENVPHERLWDSEPPENVMVTVFGKLASPGDSHHFETSADIIALPIIAPWGKTTDAINLALKLKPKIIIPIHDWMYKDGARQMMYQRLKGFFETKGIDFKTPETGEVMEV
ncbi:MAG TPA: MBL fold metallo-hydrolase [Candidatus Acidoferrales bacterium]|nr:MBL fold metallo-hydrolase [Candidatus Acidoferrales bacterium]